MKKRSRGRKSRSKNKAESKPNHQHPFRLVETLIDRLVQIMIIALAIVIILDNPLWTLVDLGAYETEVFIFDSIIIAIFVFDLIFKWFHVRRLVPFIKNYWLEIIAVFPFYLGFRILIFVSEFAKAGEEAQRILHEFVFFQDTRILREARFVQEADAAIREARPLTRFIRSASRIIRIFAARLEMVHKSMLKATYHFKEKRRGKRLR